MRCRRDTTWLWNTGQDKRNLLTILFVLLGIKELWARPDFLDSMSKQFFGLSSENEQSSPDPFAEMFGSASQQVPQRPPPRNYQNPNRHHANHPHRQGYYAPPHIVQQQPHAPPHIVHQQLHAPPHIVQQQPHVSYNGPPPVHGQQQGFGQRQPNSNETKTEGYPPDNIAHQKQHILRHPYPPADYHPHHHPQQVAAVEYHKPPATVVEYQKPYPQNPPQHVEYHHIPHQPAVVHEQHGPTLEIHTGTDHAYHEPPTHVEYHHPPEVEYHHYTTHKPKRFHLSFNEPSPDYKIIDKHVKLPPVKFRFHINPKIVITTNTKDPLDKKHHDHEHDLEPYPPPDAFSDHNAPPSINKHILEHYPVKHHYPVEHHAVEHHAAKHYAVEYPEARHPYPIEHHAAQHHPEQEFTYDLSHGHSHLNPHRSLGHYEPTFKIKTKPIVFTEPYPTRPTTTTRATTTTARTTTARTTARTTTTSRPTRRARISARNPAFSVAFTQASSTLSTTEASTTSSTTTRRSIFRNNSERESENGGILARRDELSTSAEVPQTTKSTSTTTTTTTTTSKPATTTTTTTRPTTTTTTTTRPTTTTTTTTKPSSTSTTTTQPTSTTSTATPTSTTSTSTTTTTLKPMPIITTIGTTTSQSATTETSRTSVITSQSPTIASTTKETLVTTTTQKATTTLPTIRPRDSPAEETTVRTTTFNVNANEIDMRKTTESPRRRPEPLLEESSSIDRSGSYNIESSESVKVIETTMLIDGKNQTVRFYYITQPVKLPIDVFKKMTGQSKDNPSGMNVIKIRDKRYAVFNQGLKMLRNL